MFRVTLDGAFYQLDTDRIKENTITKIKTKIMGTTTTKCECLTEGSHTMTLLTSIVKN